MLTIAIGIDRKSGLVVSGPKMVTRGFSVSEPADLIQGLANVLRAAINEHSGETDVRAMERLIRDTALRYVHAQTRRRPMILPLVLEI
jgi:ribonuclease J